MDKWCNCGHEMEITLRTIVHARILAIHHVPVYTCTVCENSELVPEIKHDVIRIMERSRDVKTPKRIQVLFEEEQEVASVLLECLEQPNEHYVTLYERVSQERVNHLLDVYLLAKTWGDMDWMVDLERRLKQLSSVNSTSYQVKIS